MNFHSEFVRLEKNGQITIPRKALKNLGVKYGDFLGLMVIGKKIIITPKFLVRGKFTLSEEGKERIEKSLRDAKEGKVKKNVNLSELDS